MREGYGDPQEDKKEELFTILVRFHCSTFLEGVRRFFAFMESLEKRSVAHIQAIIPLLSPSSNMACCAIHHLCQRIFQPADFQDVPFLPFPRFRTPKGNTQTAPVLRAGDPVLLPISLESAALEDCSHCSWFPQQNFGPPPRLLLWV